MSLDNWITGHDEPYFTELDDPPPRREYVPCSVCTCNSAPLGDECPECGEVNETTRFGERS